jgi:rhodanese-related sulfurtransferase
MSRCPPTSNAAGPSWAPLKYSFAGIWEIELAERAGELAHDRPIVAVCRAGSRSAQATVILREAGFSDVANLAGGMLRWRAEGHTVEGGSA